MCPSQEVSGLYPNLVNLVNTMHSWYVNVSAGIEDHEPSSTPAGKRRRVRTATNTKPIIEH